MNDEQRFYFRVITKLNKRLKEVNQLLPHGATMRDLKFKLIKLDDAWDEEETQNASYELYDLMAACVNMLKQLEDENNE